MGRRKKQEKAEEPEIITTISGDVKRSLVAIFLFALAVIFVLGFFGASRDLGDSLDKMAGLLVGWGKWILPLILIIAGIILLFRKETLFYVSKLIGTGVAFVALLGFFHLYFEADQFLKIAKTGAGGGYIGYGVVYILDKFAGKVAGSVILAAILLMGIVVVFDFSIVTLLEKFILNKFKKNTEEVEEELEIENEISTHRKEILEDPIIEHKNEKQTEFVHDPNEIESKIKDSTLRKLAQWGGSEKKQTKKKPQQKNSEWEFPSIDLLETETGEPEAGDTEKNANIIQETFHNFSIEVEKGEIQTGPTVTQYSFRPAVGVKLSRITSLNDNLALALASHPIRIEAPIPGKSMIGIEVKNKKPAKVRLPELLESPEFEDRESNLLLPLGKDVSGNLIFGDLKKMPHLLIAGTTGSGKSICINTILLSLLYQNSPAELKLILVDPKRVELSMYNGIPHLLADVIVDMPKVVGALKWSLGEMEKRYKLIAESGSKDIISYNKKAESGEKRTITDSETNETREEPIEKLPYIVIVIDELAELMQTHSKEVEGPIIRIAQLGRAAGIHLVLSTQKPIVTVITGLIKSNIATRIAFKVPSLMDSRTVLDASGAEKLIGNGDMLFSSTTSSSVNGIRRLQGIYVSETETKRVVEFVTNQHKNGDFIEDLEKDVVISESKKDPTKNGEVATVYSDERLDFSNSIGDGNGIGTEDDEDPLYEEAKQIIIQSQKASTSYLQRRLRLGYNRAARLIDRMEAEGIIGESEGSKPREVLVGKKDVPSYDDSVSDQIKRDKWQI